MVFILFCCDSDTNQNLLRGAAWNRSSSPTHSSKIWLSAYKKTAIQGDADLLCERNERQGARSTEWDTYHADRRAFEHRATQDFARAGNESASPWIKQTTQKSYSCINSTGHNNVRDSTGHTNCKIIGMFYGRRSTKITSPIM